MNIKFANKDEEKTWNELREYIRKKRDGAIYVRDVKGVKEDRVINLCENLSKIFDLVFGAEEE